MSNEVLTWILGAVSAMLLGFMAWVAQTLISMKTETLASLKTDIAVILHKLNGHSAAETAIAERLNMLEDDMKHLQTQIALIKQKLKIET